MSRGKRGDRNKSRWKVEVVKESSRNILTSEHEAEKGGKKSKRRKKELVRGRQDATKNESQAHSLGGVSERGSSNQLVGDDALQVSIIGVRGERSGGGLDYDKEERGNDGQVGRQNKQVVWERKGDVMDLRE